MMKCANCGNEDTRFLFDEPDYDDIHCTKCGHWTRRSDGKDDLATCPCCKNYKPRPSYKCLICEYVPGQIPYPSAEEIAMYNEAIDEIIRETGSVKVPNSPQTLDDILRIELILLES